MIILKVTKNQGFILSIEKTISEENTGIAEAILEQEKVTE